MANLQPQPLSFRLGEWHVEPSNGTLRCGADTRRIEPQLMNLLVYLVAHPGRVVSRDEIMTGVWKDTIVTDDALTSSVYQLRRALGDDAKAPRYIETVPKRGYRLLMSWEPTTAEAAPQARGRRRWPFVATAVLSLAATATVLLQQRAHRAAAEAPHSPAMALYTKGRTLLGDRNPDSLKQARVYFADALKIEPHLAPASAGLAETYGLMCAVGLGTPAELYPRARDAAVTALAADANLAESHVAMGIVRGFFEWDFRRADDEFRRAIELHPDLASARRWRALLLAAVGSRPNSIAEALKAVSLEPAYLPGRTDLILILLMARRYREAIQASQEALDLDPTLSKAYALRSWAHAFQGEDADAYADFRRTLETEKIGSDALTRLDARFAKEGLRGVFRAVARYMENDVVRTPVSDDNLVSLYSYLDDKDRAFALLERSLRERHMELVLLAVSPFFDPLRSDPRFAALVARVGLPPAVPARDGAASPEFPQK
jgi:DNA-binding winged helix-turn-helix (wHTH) protein